MRARESGCGPEARTECSVTRTVFLGTPEFAVPSLEAVDRLAGRGALDLVAVVTQPDRAGDRGRLSVPAVKARALALGVPVLQPARIDEAALREILALHPELLVWAAYGNRIPRTLLASVNDRAVNVHASLLPRWRGAAPIAHAILAGDRETGITLMEGSAALDEGPILAQERTPIGLAESAGDLTHRLAMLGADLLERAARWRRWHRSSRRATASSTSRGPRTSWLAGCVRSRPSPEHGRPFVEIASSSRAQRCRAAHRKSTGCSRSMTSGPRSRLARAGCVLSWCGPRARGR